jgi:hypothetical protein
MRLHINHVLQAAQMALLLTQLATALLVMLTAKLALPTPPIVSLVQMEQVYCPLILAENVQQIIILTRPTNANLVILHAPLALMQLAV